MRAYLDCVAEGLTAAPRMAALFAGHARRFGSCSRCATMTGRRTGSGLFGTGVADYAVDPRYAELLWEVSAEMVGRS